MFCSDPDNCRVISTCFYKKCTESKPAEGCDGNTGKANDDVWFTFNPTQAGKTTITLTPDLIFDGVINAYSVPVALWLI